MFINLSVIISIRTIYQLLTEKFIYYIYICGKIIVIGWEYPLNISFFTSPNSIFPSNIILYITNLESYNKEKSCFIYLKLVRHLRQQRKHKPCQILKALDTTCLSFLLQTRSCLTYTC